jgi:hypothetical protein
MKHKDIQNLLGGYATDTLTDRERELLFSAALHNQELFNALADEQALRECLSDPATRRQLLQALEPREPGVLERLTSWMRRPASWAVAGGVMAALVVGVAIRRPRPPALETAKNTAPVETTTGAKPAEQPAVAPQPPLARRAKVTTPASRDKAESEREARRAMNAPAVAPAAPLKDEAAASAIPKLKLAVLDFDSDARSEPAKETDSTRADVGKTASDLLGKKLDSNGYTVIDRKQVDQALQSQNLKQRQLDPSTAASLGRSLGADAIIVGSVKMQFAPQKGAAGAGGFRAATPQAQSKFTQQNEIKVTAQAINTQTAGNLAVASAQGEQAPGGGLAGAVDQVASSLGRQFQQNARIKIEGLVTNMNAGVLTLNIGSKAGVKVGDRLEIRRDGKTIGRVAIGTVRDSLSAGFFEGASPPRIGDTVSNASQ